MEEQHWHDATLHCFGMLLDGRAPTTGKRQPGKEATLLILFNADHNPVTVTLPDCAGSSEWIRLLDTNASEESETPSFKVGTPYVVADRSLVLFAVKADSSGQEAPASS
jgi:glycogen operon protein